MPDSDPVFIHPNAEVQTQDIGAGSKVWQYSILLRGAKIGKNCKIDAHCFVENDVRIGDNVTLKCGVYVWDGITIGDDVFVGPNVTFTNDKYPRSGVQPPEFAKTIIRRGASIGANATIVCGVTIGADSMIGAGSVVTRDVPDGELWYGNPARRRGRAPRRSSGGNAGSASPSGNPHVGIAPR
jgi:acetyltransferase-like isoleucine patch superfamily enzyme